VIGSDANLKIGSNTGMTGAVIYCLHHIEIGSNVLIGANARIWDTDHHALDYMERRLGSKGDPAPVIIEDDVWLGADSVVLKGVRIGARSVVAARAVVTKNVPSDVIVAGVPAKIIRHLRPIDGFNDEFPKPISMR